MTFLEIVEKNKENFLNEMQKKIKKSFQLNSKDLEKYWNSLEIKEKNEYEEYKDKNSWYFFLLNYLEDKQNITEADFEYDINDLLL